MATTHNVSHLISRIQKTTSNLAPDSPGIREALTRIGLYVSAVAKTNVRRQRLVDTGRLINSVAYEFFKQGDVSGVQIGSFNVPYAAVHEFGYRGPVQVPAHTRTMSSVYGRKLDTPITASVRAHTRNVNIRERAYLRPAFRSTQTFIIDTLRAALLSTK